MEIKGGFAGNILYIDLTSGQSRKETLALELANKYIGGWGINYRLAWDLIKPGVDPLSPDNPIILGVGPGVGTFAPGETQIEVTVKFPLPASEDGRCFIGTAFGGSRRFGAMMKSAGYDHIVITGRAKNPVYLKITDDDVELCDAGDLWGKKDVLETNEELLDRHRGYGVIAIGHGGEHLVKFSMAVVEKRSSLGRHGLGAIMGSKNLKAIVIKGSKGIKVADRIRFTEAVDTLYRQLIPMPAVQAMHIDGAHSVFNNVFIHQMNPGVWLKSKWDTLYGVAKWKEVKRDLRACTSCLVGCRCGYEIKDGEFAGLKTEGPQYCVAGIIGETFNITDHRKALKLMDTAHRLDIDLVNSNGMIDWVTRLYAEGKITEKETGGMKLTREFDTYLKLYNMIARREGIGDAMADGWYALAKRMGQDPWKDNLQLGITKGTETIYPGRARKLDTLAFVMITSPRGAHHPPGHSLQVVPLQDFRSVSGDCKFWGIPEDKFNKIFTPALDYYGLFHVGRLAKWSEDVFSAYSCMSQCTVYRTYPGVVSIAAMAELYSSLTGIETSPEEFRDKAEAVHNLYKMLNVREGFSRKDDVIPEIWLKGLNSPDEPMFLTDYYRTRRFRKADIEKLLDDYYDERGWDIPTGIPTKRKLTQLGLVDMPGIMELAK